MNYNNITLIIPKKPDSERDSVARVWKQKGGAVLRLEHFWKPPALDPKTIRVYGNDTFCLVLAQKLKLELIFPADNLLTQVPEKFLKRKVECIALKDTLQRKFPAFIKSAAPKIFKASVYESSEELLAECRYLSLDTLTLISDIVDITSEARCFIYERKVLDCAIYLGNQDVNTAAVFAQQVAKNLDLPSTCVLDVGFIPGLGWAIIEFNASWGAGLNGCDPKKVVPAIAYATQATV